MNEITIIEPNNALIVGNQTTSIPTLFTDAGDSAVMRVIEFFTAQIPNNNTRKAYFKAVSDFGLWCELYGLRLEAVTPVHVAQYIRELGETKSIPSVKQHLAGIRVLFDFLVTGHIIATNPAHSVRTPRYSIKIGKTPVLSAEEARHLFASIDISTSTGLRDRALIAVMTYSFARVGAVVAMNFEDYFPQGKRWRFRLHEKGGKEHVVWAHHKAEEYVDAYLEALGEVGKKTPLFRTLNRKRQLSDKRITRNDVLRMIKRRAKKAGLPDTISCHTFRATGITEYLKNGGKLEYAQELANHASSTTTKLYDRRNDEISLDEIERVGI